MESLSEKWKMAIPIILGVFLVFFGIIVIARYAIRPDTRTVNEVLNDRYKTCVDNAYADNVEKCTSFLKLETQ